MRFSNLRNFGGKAGRGQMRHSLRGFNKTAGSTYRDAIAGPTLFAPCRQFRELEIRATSGRGLAKMETALSRIVIRSL